MHIFRRPHYESEITQFIHQMKDEKPNLESRQLAGRALLWDKNVDRSAMAEYQEARVAQGQYVYYDNDNAMYMQEHKQPEPAAHQV